MNASLDVDLTLIPELDDELLVRLDRIREAAPVFWSEAQQAWFVTRHEDVAAGFQGKYPLSSDRSEQMSFTAIPVAEWGTRIPLLSTAVRAFANWNDPPAHARLRRPLAVALAPANVDRLREFVKQRTREVLDTVADGEAFEFIAKIGRPLTGSIIMRIMGMPEQYLPKLKDWAQAIVAAAGTARPSVAILDAAESAMREMNVAFQRELRARLDDPQPDLLSALAQASLGDDGLSEGELLGTCVNTLLAGHESTASTLAMGVAALSRRPDQVEYLLAHPERRIESVAELSRFVAMSASQARVVLEDFEWHGAWLRKADAVYLWIASGNRDPRVFDHPDRLDLSRDASKSLVFGGGIHLCVGHLLAKLELSEAYPAIFERFRVELAGDRIPFTGGYSFRTIDGLDVRFHARR